MRFSVGEAGDYGLFQARAPAASTGVPLAVTLDGTRTWAGVAGPGMHEEYRWFAPIAPAPTALTGGPHTLRLDHVGGDQGRTTGVAGFVLHPVVATRTLAAPDGVRLRLGFDLRRGHLSWEEDDIGPVGEAGGRPSPHALAAPRQAVPKRAGWCAAEGEEEGAG